jgi:hypothetical protein
VRLALRGRDRAESPALPVGEALHPVALVALAVLVANDWALKPRFGPSAITGKLSDLAGLVFAPVVLSSGIGLVLHVSAKLGARIDPSLSRQRLLACIAATGGGFTAVKLSAGAAQGLADLLSHLGRHAEFCPDRTDLLCLPALAISWWIGRDELRRVPLGRPAAIHRLGLPASFALADTGAARELVVAIDAWDVTTIDRLIR